MPKHTDMQHLVDGLNAQEPGYQPVALFNAIARLVVTPTFVVIPFFKRKGITRCVLTRRADDDPHYPGMLHPPGKIILSTDRDLDAVCARLLQTELPELRPTAKPKFVAPVFEQIHRGKEISLIHFLAISDPAEAMSSFDALNLPDDVIATDIPRIQLAYQADEREE